MPIIYERLWIYLGQAALAGFKFIEDDDIESTERIAFTKDDSVQVCKKLQKKIRERYAKIYKK